MNIRLTSGELLIQGTAGFPVVPASTRMVVALVSVADESASDSVDRIAIGNIASKRLEFVSDGK
jgi:hypothetical protein